MDHRLFVEHLAVSCDNLRFDDSVRAFRSRFMTCWHVSFFLEVDFALRFGGQCFGRS